MLNITKSVQNLFQIISEHTSRSCVLVIYLDTNSRRPGFWPELVAMTSKQIMMTVRILLGLISAKSVVVIVCTS